MTPRETFDDLRTRRYRQLIDAGIEADMAWEVAHHNAMETVRARLMAAVPMPNTDNYESSPNVYGEYS